MEKVSVIVPVYNGEKYLAKTLQSILESSYKNIEIIIVDDGSTDSSADIYNEFMKDDERIRLIKQENQGIAAARNTGMANAQGDFISFCDQDDLIVKDMYQIMVSKLISDNSELCLCGTVKMDNNFNEVTYEQFETSVYEKNDIKTKLLFPFLFTEYNLDFIRTQDIICASIWKCVISRKFILDNNILFKRFISYEDDWIFFIEILTFAEKVSTVKEQLYKWRINFLSESHREKYVQELPVKQGILEGYIEKKLKKGAISPLVIDQFSIARMYIDIIKIYENLASKNCLMSWKEKRIYISENIPKKYIPSDLVKISQLKKGYWRYKLVLKQVEKGHYKEAYIVNIVLKKAANALFRINIGARLEAFIKKQ